MGSGDVPAEATAEDPPPGLKQCYPPTSFIVQMSEEADVVGVSVRGVPRMALPICTGSPRALLLSPWLVVARAPKGWCPCMGARRLETGELLCPAQTVFLCARLGERLHDLFEIQIYAWTQQSR